MYPVSERVVLLPENSPRAPPVYYSLPHPLATAHLLYSLYNFAFSRMLRSWNHAVCMLTFQILSLSNRKNQVEVPLRLFMV